MFERKFDSWSLEKIVIGGCGVVVASLLAAGCPEPEPSTPGTPTQDAGADGMAGADVADGASAVECRSDSDCDSGVCMEGTCVAPSCDDGVANGGETDVDCGGPECPVCEEGDACEAGSDCASGVCGDDGTCSAPTCSDGVQNGGEVDVDCGGEECPACESGSSCGADTDCTSGVCDDGVCAEPTCDDGVANGEESDVDCGGSCEACESGASCEVNEDCQSMQCGSDGTCVAASCDDDVENGGETDVDCGGPSCKHCEDGLKCERGSDCASGNCDGGTCAAPTCSDGIENGGETDVDCGGPLCGPCENSKSCEENGDCLSGVCDGGTCVASSCQDDVQNGEETDVDCGGIECAGCAPSKSCERDSDCASGVCSGGTCAEPGCNDDVQNGDETGVDCGGSCGPCPVGSDCEDKSDCRSGVCTSNRCAAPTCSDDVQNGEESDVDCGGSCEACDIGGSCNSGSDCVSGSCQLGSCTEPTCADDVENGDETDVDCGGPDCGACPLGGTCASDGDCEGDFVCSGSDGETCVACENGATRSTDESCGYEDRGSVEETCNDYSWEESGCTDVWYASCREIKEDDPSASTGSYTIYPDGPSGSAGAVDVHCEMEADGGVGYTMVRYDDDSLGGNQDDYRNLCQQNGLEVIVPRSRAHADAIKSWNGGEAPNLVNVFPESDGATGLDNWEGRCQGGTCNFFISKTNSAGCGNFEPNGDNNTDYSLYRRDSGCAFGDWNDAHNKITIQGWVVCSTNDAGPGTQKSCRDYRESDSVQNRSSRGTSGIYTVDPDGASGSTPERDVYCDMQEQGGGWTLVSVMGTDGRPGSWDSNDYPRPGASSYGSLSGVPSEVASIRSGAQSASSYSWDAVNFFSNSNREFLAYVGGNTTDYVYGTLPSGCNYFDGSDWCEENTYGPFSVMHSDGSELTADAYACTTARQNGGYDNDEYDEFGLHVIEGQENDDRNCHSNDNSSLGHQDIGRVYTTFESSDKTQYWTYGVHSHWNESGVQDEPGYLLVR